MKKHGSILGWCLGASLLLHLAMAAPFFCVPKGPHPEKKSYTVATLVTIKKAPLKPPEPVAPKPKIKKVTPQKRPVPIPPPKKKAKTTPKPKHKALKKKIRRPQPAAPKPKKTSTSSLPAANRTKTKDKTPKKEPIKPVFGLTRESVRQSGDAALSARVGNTLMTPQEEAFTPPEEVEDYASVPPFELSRLPLYKTRVTPEYPEPMKAAGRQGEVLLAVTIDENGKVVALKVKRSNNALFAKAALAALKKCEFTPGLQNGAPVTTTIDIPIKFMLDD
jgi:periplasmic protein TonB